MSFFVQNQRAAAHGHKSHGGCIALTLMLLLLGCRENPEQPVRNPGIETGSALQSLRSAVNNRDWESAEELVSPVLLDHHNDADVLQLVARVVHLRGKLDTAADLMCDACRAESYASPDRAKQAIASLLETGRLYDAIEFLEHVVGAKPDEAGLRRMLYQMCWGVEERRRSQPHGRHLIRNRQFDLSLLIQMSATERRVERSDSLIEMARRHPKDKRPLIAEARIQFDSQEFDKAADLLRESMLHHPDHPPAIALLGRALVDLAKYEEFAALAQAAPSKTGEHPPFLLAQGDWCTVMGLHAQAARAYWEATKLDPDLRLPWLRLSAALKQIGPTESGLDSSQIAAIDNRVRLLSRFSQARAEFIKVGKSSAQLAIEVAKILHDLGRAWEAEAWASIATTLASDEGSGQVTEARQAIVKSLRQSTPWQEITSHAALRMDLSHLPQPKMESDNRIDVDTKHKTRFMESSPKPISIFDEAEARSLVFFGRTGDQLEQPGVQFYQTLGCGGGTIDFDLDGWSDLYLAAAGGTPPEHDSQSNSLWRNLEGEFQDVTLPSGSIESGFGQGVAVGDVNEDGFPDLLVMNYGLNSLRLNNGDGTFMDSSQSLGTSNIELEWSSSGAIADINGDGLADLTILNYGSGLDPVTRQCLHPTTQVARACSPLVFPGAADRFLINSGALQAGTVDFGDRTSQCGEPSIVGRGLGLIVGSFGLDAKLGIFVANDMNSNHYWSKPSNNANLLDETAILRGLGSDDRAAAQGSMGVAAADLDRDGDLDLYVTNFQGEPNTYHEQISDQFYRDQTTTLNLASPTIPLVGFGTEAIDLDNNGYLELVVLNGHIDDFPSEASGSYAQPMDIFQRRSNGEFGSIIDSVGSDYASDPHIGRALWTIDANRDGRMDFVTTHQTEPVALLVNQTERSGNWISLKLVGELCSRDAIGSRIDLQCEGLTATSFLVAGDGYLCSNERLVHFGIAEHQQPCQLKVTWPDGSIDLYDGLGVNHRWLVVQNSPKAFQLD